MATLTLEITTPVNVTSTGNVGPAGTDVSVMGWYVNSTSAGTLVLRKGGSGGTVLCGTITPAIGFHRFPAACPGGLHATVGGTLDVTFFIVPSIA